MESPEKGRENALEGGKPWQVGGVFIAGFAPSYTVHAALKYGVATDFYSAGLELGKIATDIHGKGWTAGRGEAIVDILPFWLAYAPKQNIAISYRGVNEFSSVIDPISWHGATVTPLLFRWNFTRPLRGPVVPYVQLGSGLLWTGRKFPIGKGTPGGTTSRINFTPQIGFGANIFSRETQSVSAGVNVIHVSSAGIGDYNPGVNVTVQFGIGYSWWKR